MKSNKRKSAAGKPSRSKTLLACRETEIEMTRRAYEKTNNEIVRMLTCVELMRRKQIARQNEIARQLSRLNGRANARSHFPSGSEVT